MMCASGGLSVCLLTSSFEMWSLKEIPSALRDMVTTDEMHQFSSTVVDWETTFLLLRECQER